MKNTLLCLTAASALVILSAGARGQTLDVAYATDGHAYVLASYDARPPRLIGPGLSWSYGPVAGTRIGGGPVAGLGVWASWSPTSDPLHARLGLSYLTGDRPALVLGATLGFRL